MKTNKSLKRSRNASYNRIVAVASAVLDITTVPHTDLTTIDMANLRELTNELSQRFHEFNAYQNALNTD